MSERNGTYESTAGLSAERIARNESVFRAANELINEFAEALAMEGKTPFICECADRACEESILMTRGEYAEVRRDARRFVSVPGHEASAQGWAQVVERHPSYVVAEKVGSAGEVAEQLEGNPDPVTANVDIAAKHAPV